MTAKSKGQRGGPKPLPLDSTAEFEALLQQPSGSQHYVLKLYVTGTTPRSAQAIANIRALCEERLAGRYDLEVVDIYQQPTQAVGQQIIAAPTLVKQLPVPVRRLVGDMSNRQKVLVALNLVPSDPGTDGETKWIEL